jgi:hypothetical protein
MSNIVHLENVDDVKIKKYESIKIAKAKYYQKKKDSEFIERNRVHVYMYIYIYVQVRYPKRQAVMRRVRHTSFCRELLGKGNAMCVCVCVCVCVCLCVLFIFGGRAPGLSLASEKIHGVRKSTIAFDCGGMNDSVHLPL